jgi:LAGLIDADG-like domain
MAYLSHPLTANQVSYLAGLYEAEGAFIAGSPSKPRVPIVILGMTDEDVVQRVGGLLRVAVLRVKPGSERWKPVYRVHLNGGRAVSFMTLLQSCMGERRRLQINEAIECYKTHYNYSYDKYLLVHEEDQDVEKHWLAGYYEGEGYFGLTKQVKRYGTYFYPIVVVNSTDIDVIEHVRQIVCLRYDININIYKSKQKRERKEIYRLRVSGNIAQEMMKDLYPFMGQRRQAKIAEILEKSRKIS